MSSQFQPEVPQRWRYDVFLSFRGACTSGTFIGQLYHALLEKGVNVFMATEQLRGQDLSIGIIEAIRNSRISVIVFSRNYAHSTRSPQELAEIIECRKSSGQIVLPVFYDVDPSDVRNQTGSVREAIQKHGRKLDLRTEEVKIAITRWNAALKEAGSLSGWDLTNHFDGRVEAKLIEDIVNKIWNELNNACLYVAKYPIGIDYQVKNITAQLYADLDDSVRFVGICGMGGIGKTTLAKAVFNQFFHTFEAKCFLASVRQQSEQPNGLVHLQEQLLCDLLNQKIELGTVDGRNNAIKERLYDRRVLIVLDDLSDSKQLKALARERAWFGPGSRIIITTRKKDLLEETKVDYIYMVEVLNDDESLNFFNLHAFGNCHPKEEFVDLSKAVVTYCGGLPLALEVLGSVMRDRSSGEWRYTLGRLRRIPHNIVQEGLQLSFDELDDNEKEVFLHIACFFVGGHKDHVIIILNGCGLFGEIGIKGLTKRCLLKVEQDRLVMHDLIRDMGREIIRRESPNNTGNRSRLWFYNDIMSMLENHTGTGKVEGLALSPPVLHKISAQAFSGMDRLKLLQLNNVHVHGKYGLLSKELIWICWHNFPLESIPEDFYMGNMVSIDMQYSKLKAAWETTKILKNLKFLNLSRSYLLSETPDFSGLPNLEKLILDHCIGLEEINPSIGHLQKIVLVSLRDCRKLKSLPKTICFLRSVKILDITGCSKIKKLPDDMGGMESLVKFLAQGTVVKQVPSSIACWKNLKVLSLHNCRISSSITSLWSWVSVGVPPEGNSNNQFESLQDLMTSKLLGVVSSLRSWNLQNYLGKTLQRNYQVLTPLECLTTLCKLDVVGYNLSAAYIPASIGNGQSLEILYCSDRELLPDMRSSWRSCMVVAIRSKQYRSFFLPKVALLTEEMIPLYLTKSAIQRSKVVPKGPNFDNQSGPRCSLLDGGYRPERTRHMDKISVPDALPGKVLLILGCYESSPVRFLSHLSSALKAYQISISVAITRFMAEKDVKEVIESSELCMPVFTEDENVLLSRRHSIEYMAECGKRSPEKVILPIFYGIKPSEVLQKIDDLNASSTLPISFVEVLRDVANTSGWVVRNPSSAEVVSLIAQEVSNILGYKQDMADHLVGMGRKVEFMMDLLDIEVFDRRVVGICGTGGVGKTVLAKAVYRRISSSFDGSCFLQDIGKTIKRRGNGLQSLQTKLISDVLKRECEKIDSVDEGISFLEGMLREMKVLVVLDNVHSGFNLEELVGKFHCLGPGSRIIITTRCKDNLPKGAATYDIPKMSQWEVLEHFKKHVPKDNIAPDADCRKLRHDIASNVGGIPLVVEVISSFLSHKSISVWKDTAEKLKQLPEEEIYKKLMISFETLNPRQKQIFMDIACFADGEDHRITSYLWHYPTEPGGLKDLIDMALVKIGENNELWMHSELRELGRQLLSQEISRNEGIESMYWLWFQEVNFETVLTKKGIEKVEALHLCFDDRLEYQDIELRMMPNIRYLKLDRANIVGDFNNIFPNLRWLHWEGCPRNFCATNLNLKSLVILNLSRSGITESWGGWSELKMANALKVLDLTDCAELTITPDFSGFPNLERLILERCCSLVKLDPSICHLKNLRSLNLSFCTELSALPKELGLLRALKELLIDGTTIREIPVSLGRIEDIETLSASGCFLLTGLPRSIGCLQYLSDLSLDHTKINELPSSISRLVRLERLSVRDCQLLSELPRSIGELSNSLLELDVSRAGIYKLPNSIGNLSRLRVLKAESCFIEEFPSAILELANLEEIHASYCRNLKQFFSSENVPCEHGKLKSLKILRLEYSCF